MNMLLRNYILLLLAIALLSSISCSNEKVKQAQNDIIIAEVNKKPILGSDFLKEYKTFKKRIKVTDANNEEMERQMRDGVMENMVRAELIKEEAAKAGIKITKEKEDEAIRAMLGEIPPSDLKKFLDKEHVTYDEWKESVGRNMLSESLVKNVVSKQVEVKESEVKKYYDEHEEQFKKPTQAHAFHIVSPTAQEA
jgi:parvulin-like peptidyl-prolyl isomerase